MGGLEPISPAQRVYDSRPDKGLGGTGPFAVGETRTIQILGRGGAPLSGVAGIVGNATSIAGSVGGYFTIWPAGHQKPPSSNINFSTSGNLANLFTCMLGPTGAINVYNGASVGANLCIDVQAWIRANELVAVGPSVLRTPTVPTASDSVKASQILATAMRYAVDTWWPGPAQVLLATDLGYAAAAASHDAVRRLSMAALGMSTAVFTGLTIDPGTLTARVIALVDRVAGAHVVNVLGGWGEGWQTSMWSSIVGRAAWLVWERVPEATRAAVARMVAHEADYAARYRIKYYRDAAGNYLRDAAGNQLIGDSGAEEVAWQGTAMQIALAMLPGHVNARIWATEMRRFALAAWARPQDV